MPEDTAPPADKMNACTRQAVIVTRLHDIKIMSLDVWSTSQQAFERARSEAFTMFPAMGLREIETHLKADQHVTRNGMSVRLVPATLHA